LTERSLAEQSWPEQSLPAQISAAEMPASSTLMSAIAKYCWRKLLEGKPGKHAPSGKSSAQ
jgi:hypothetical protein